jgi:hypothetical protein
MLALLLFVASSCDTGVDNSSNTRQPDNAGSASTAGETGDKIDGDADEGGGDGENGGVSAETGEKSAETDESDDVNAAPTAADYPPEVKKQLDSFFEIAGGLPLDDVPSAAALLAAYRRLALEGPVNDALFFMYEEYMQFVCEGLNAACEDEPPEGPEINDAVENGFLFIADDDYYSYFILRPDFLKYTFTDSVSARTGAFLNLLAKHYDFHGGSDLTLNNTLMVTLDQLAEMIVDWENYLGAYPSAPNRSDIESNLDYYKKIYIGSIQIENTGFYSLEGVDENGETLYKLMTGPRQSYLRFIENYPDSEFHPLIVELFTIYADNSFLYTAGVEDFFRKHGLAYDL